MVAVVSSATSYLEEELVMAKYTLKVNDFGLLDIPGRDNGVPTTNLGIDWGQLTLSMVWGAGAYCNRKTVEVAVIKDGEFITENVWRYISGETLGDDVHGYCDAETVHSYFVTCQAMREGRVDGLA
jgi:hypothetical protein